MPLPLPGQQTTAPNPATLTAAHLNHPPALGANANHEAREGTLTWVGNIMQVTGGAATNYCYIPGNAGGAVIRPGVSYGVVDCAGGGPDFWVISDQFGGCEWHEVYHAGLNMLGFLHVYRSSEGGISKYKLETGWVLRNKKRSSVLSTSPPLYKAVWAVSLINRGNNPPTVQSKFIKVSDPPFVFAATPGAGGMVAAAPTGNLNITHEDNGDTDYTVAQKWTVFKGSVKRAFH
jgi:hypothetical protein